MTLTYDEIKEIPCSTIKTYPQEDINDIVNVVIDHYYEKGFPYYPLDIAKVTKEYDYLKAFDVNDLELPEKHLQQNMTGLNTANTFHPEMWHTQCRDAKTPYEIFTDRNLFSVALHKRIKYSDTKLTDFNIRKSLKAFGVQAVSNFRPTIAKWVYERFTPIGGFVLDPCAGYGGRLLGAYASHIGKYFGVDPSYSSYVGNCNMKYTLDNLKLNEIDFHPKVVLAHMPFEDLLITTKYDLVFTSPPYYNVEKYDNNNNEDQSYMRYPTYQLWKEIFLSTLIRKSYHCLNTGGYLVLNVGKPIIEDTAQIGTDLFKHPPEIYHMRLSKILGQGNKSTSSHKTEPMFVWRKT